MQILARARIRKSQVYLTPALLSDHLLNTVGSMNVQRPNNTMAINWLVISGIYFSPPFMTLDTLDLGPLLLHPT